MCLISMGILCRSSVKIARTKYAMLLLARTPHKYIWMQFMFYSVFLLFLLNMGVKLLLKLIQVNYIYSDT